MSKIRLTVSRLLALGGLTVASGTGLSLYRYSLFNDDAVAECRSPISTNPCNYGRKENDPLNKEWVHWDDNWDFRKPSVSKTKVTEASVPVVEHNGATTNVSAVPKPTATRHVILVRHGQYVHANKSLEKKLTELGRQQASITGERLKSLNVNFDNITVSTMVRAQETAAIIGQSMPDVPLSECCMLREGAPYPPEPPGSASWDPSHRAYFRDNPRIEGAFRKYIHRADPSQTEDSYELIVCHGNVIRYFVCRALQFPPEGWLRMSVGNCGLTWLSIKPSGKVSLRNLGDTGHLPPDMITFN